VNRERLAYTDRPRPAGPSFFWIVLLLLVAAPVAAGDCKRPELLRVHDGDTVSLRCAQGVVKLRLGGIDSPEYGQAHGRQARAALQRLLAGHTLEVQTRATDRYGRRIGDVLVDGHSVSLQMVEQGWAWCGQRAAAECRARQQRARKARLGLWQQAEPMPPWHWRRLNPRKD
jgi:micrococcal nuclease